MKHGDVERHPSISPRASASSTRRTTTGTTIGPRQQPYEEQVPHTKSNGVAARAACECALGGTLLPFGVRASRRLRMQRNDTAPRMHKFAQVDGTVQHHGRARPAKESDGFTSREYALGGTLLPFGVCATHRVRIQRNNIALRTREFARAMEMPSDHAARDHGHIRARTLTARPGCKSSRSFQFEYSQFRRQAKSHFKRKVTSSSWRPERRQRILLFEKRRTANIKS